ncbi:MAG: hypothetical protein PHR06_14965, partial [Candidatus Cloacimonetes bacterium]|nr:hypothetical protein [Candidatus Cloacimonadota bacterium]
MTTSDRVNGSTFSFSWTVYSEFIAVKSIDASFIRYRITGIPRAICSYWEVNFEENQKRSIAIVFCEESFTGDIHITNNRARLSWRKNLQNKMIEEFPRLQESRETYFAVFHKRFKNEYDLQIIGSDHYFEKLYFMQNPNPSEFPINFFEKNHFLHRIDEYKRKLQI